MKGMNKIYCASPTGEMDEPGTEGLLSECFLDLDSWCHQPQDELNTPKPNSQNEFTVSFDDQSKYFKWNALSPIAQSDMWEPNDNLLSPPLQLEEDNNNLQIQPMHSLEKSVSYTEYTKNDKKESPIRYRGNLVLTQCTYDSLDPEIKKWMSDTAPTADSTDVASAANSILTPGADDINTLPTSTSSQSSLFGLSNPSDLDYKWEVFCEIKEEPNFFTEMECKPTPKKPKAPLKLNITAANKSSSSGDMSSFPLSTPDVLQSLSEDPGFSILNFVDGNDEQNLLSNDQSSSNLIPTPKEIDHNPVNPEAILSDHDYTDTRTFSDEGSYTNLETIKEEPNSPLPDVKKASTSRKRKHTAASEDYVFDSDIPSDDSSDWSPSSSVKKSKAKRRNSKATAKRSRLSSESDNCSIISGPDRYRELRDRNNEASRRSRMNRKQKEMEMLDMASSLENENVVLKNRASSLEKRVKALREILMKVVLDRNSKT